MEQTTQEVLDLAAKHFQVAHVPGADDDFEVELTACKRSRCRAENHFGINCLTMKCRA
jgi:hypothetical protein